jgi:hypothetical protein
MNVRGKVDPKEIAVKSAARAESEVRQQKKQMEKYRDHERSYDWQVGVTPPLGHAG